MVYAELPATIRRHIESVFAGLHWDICFVHLDEIIVTRKTFEELLSNLRNASDRLKGAGLIIKPMAKDWCLFAFYVHLPWACNISKKNRNRCNQIAAVGHWPVPTNTTIVRSLPLLQSYYMRLINDFSTVAKCWHTFTENRTYFKWRPGYQWAFYSLHLS